MSLGDLITLTDDFGWDSKLSDAMADSIKIFMDNRELLVESSDYSRVSKLYNLCPVEEVLQFWKPRYRKVFDGVTTLKMQVGTDLHFYLQNFVFGPMGILWGTWVKNDLKSIGFHPDPSDLSWRFQEEYFVNDDLKLTGHCDGRICAKRIEFFLSNMIMYKRDKKQFYKEMYDIKDLELSLLEIKSVSSFEFNRLEKGGEIPDYYKCQASNYLEFANLQIAYFFYIERDQLRFLGKKYRKEDKWVNSSKRKLEIIKKAKSIKVLPEQKECLTPNDKRAKECPYRVECWDKKLDIDRYIEEGKLVKLTINSK
jgi:hypothetical protein